MADEMLEPNKLTLWINDSEQAKALENGLISTGYEVRTIFSSGKEPVVSSDTFLIHGYYGIFAALSVYYPDFMDK